MSGGEISHECKKCYSDTEPVSLNGGGRIGWFCHNCALFHPGEGVDTWPLLRTDGGVTDRGEETITVAVPRADSQGECFHAKGAPCGSHLARNVETTIGDLLDAGLHPCSNCVDDHGLPTGERGEDRAE